MSVIKNKLLRINLYKYSLNYDGFRNKSGYKINAYNVLVV